MMCLCLVRYPGTTITRKRLRNCYLSNTDGGGLAFAHAGKLFIEKGFFGFRRLYKRFREIERNYPESCIVVHFRTMTSGGKSEETCHPFYVNDNLAFAHNGIFSGLGTLKQSDTQVFNETVLKKLPNNFLKDSKIFKQIEKYADKSLSKFVFLDNKNNVTIFNIEGGVWEDGVWFSNSGYKFEYSSYYNSYNHFGFSGEEDDYSSYTSPTYRRACVICKVHQSLLGMKWVSRFGGWVCESCRKLMENEISANGYFEQSYEKLKAFDYKCTVCQEHFHKEDGKHIKAVSAAHDKFYCDGCWASLKASFSVVCPHCGSSIVMEWEDVCPICNSTIDEEDYALQLRGLECLD